MEMLSVCPKDASSRPLGRLQPGRLRPERIKPVTRSLRATFLAENLQLGLDGQSELLSRAAVWLLSEESGPEELEQARSGIPKTLAG